MRTPFLYLRNGLTDRVQIWCVVGDSLVTSFPHVMGEIYLHVRACAPLLRISETAARIGLKFIGWLGIHRLCGLLISSSGVHMHVRTCAPLFQYLWNGWVDCVEIRFVVSDSVSRDFAEAKGRMHPHMCTCKPSLPFLARSFIAEYGVLLVVVGKCLQNEYLLYL